MPDSVLQSPCTSTPTQYEAEHRLAIVMYGGVSLAVYIGGIARELLGIVRATAPKPDCEELAGLRDDELSPSEKIYRRVACMGGKPGDARAIRKRVSIDIITGTSAGGINGVFLAKALANDADMNQILNLWVEEGDLSRLLNDNQSLDGEDSLELQNPPAALLNGERMYRKLLAAFDDMDKHAKKEKRYEPGRVDLFVTTTDIRGEVINLPITNAVAQERRHRQRFHFTHDGTHSGEFANSENPTLAYAARCTSSFPFAFEPFTWSDAARLAGESRASQANWQDRLMFKNKNYHLRPMGDGGYLDNKPFSYAIEELARRQSKCHVTRTMLYVEPDPVAIDCAKAAAEQEQKPDAIDNALAALISIPGYETIREDLQKVVERNERVKAFHELERQVEGALEGWPGFQNGVWDLESLVRQHGPAFKLYHEIKVASVIDTLADLICVAGSIARPEIAQAVRDLVRAWTRRTFSSPDDEMQLMLDADIDYRLRKLSFLLRKIGSAQSPAMNQARTKLKKIYDGLYAIRGRLRDALQTWVLNLIQETGIDQDADLAPIARIKDKAIREKEIDKLVQRLQQQGAELRELLARTSRKLLMRSSKAVDAALSHPELGDLRAYLGKFQGYDMVIFPMVRNGGIDEGVEVGVVRVSPRDVNEPHGLRGNGLGHFAAFLEDDWRRNDILWGRLDAAETIIKLIIPEGESAVSLISEVQQAIIKEELGAELSKRLAVASSPKADAEPLSIAEQRRRQLTLDAAAKNCLGNDDLLQRLFVGGRGYDERINRDRQLLSIGRAGVIVEKILRTSAQKASFPWPMLPKLLASTFAILAQIAVPRSFLSVAAEYWGRLLALIFITLTAVGIMIPEKRVFSIGARGLAVTGAAALAAFLLRRWLGERLKPTLIAAGAGLVVIGIVAVIVLRNVEIPARFLEIYETATTPTRAEWFVLGVALGMTVVDPLLKGLVKLRAWWRRSKTAPSAKPVAVAGQ